MNALSPMQPELRAFPVFAKLPAGCVMHPISDERSFPVLSPGDVVVVDTTQRHPIDRELFVIEYGKASGRPNKTVVETFLRFGRYGKAGGDPYAYEDSHCWFTGPYYRPRSADEVMEWIRSGKAATHHMMVDGPVGADESGTEYMRDRIVGRIVGILEPNFDERSLRRVN